MCPAYVPLVFSSPSSLWPNPSTRTRTQIARWGRDSLEGDCHHTKSICVHTQYAYAYPVRVTRTHSSLISLFDILIQCPYLIFLFNFLILLHYFISLLYFLIQFSCSTSFLNFLIILSDSTFLFNFLVLLPYPRGEKCMRPWTRSLHLVRRRVASVGSVRLLYLESWNIWLGGYAGLGG